MTRNISWEMMELNCHVECRPSNQRIRVATINHVTNCAQYNFYKCINT